MRKNKAFTLIELMMSSVILVVALFSLLSSFITCYGLSESARNTTIAIEDGRRVMEQMHSNGSASLSTVTSQDWTAWAAANGCNTLTQEQILVVYADRDADGDSLDDNPLAPTVSVTWQDRGRWRVMSFGFLLTPR